MLREKSVMVIETFQRTSSSFKVVRIGKEFLKTATEYWTRCNLERFYLSLLCLAFHLRLKTVVCFRNPPRKWISHNLTPISTLFTSTKASIRKFLIIYIFLMLIAAAQTWFLCFLICCSYPPQRAYHCWSPLIHHFLASSLRLNNERFSSPLFVGHIF